MFKIFIISILLLPSLLFAEPRLRPDNWATAVIGSELENLYQVAPGIFRSEQPSDKDFITLEKFGISEVLNLRQYNSFKTRDRCCYRKGNYCCA